MELRRQRELIAMLEPSRIDAVLADASFASLDSDRDAPIDAPRRWRRAAGSAASGDSGDSAEIGSGDWSRQNLSLASFLTDPLRWSASGDDGEADGRRSADRAFFPASPKTSPVRAARAATLRNCAVSELPATSNSVGWLDDGELLVRRVVTSLLEAEMRGEDEEDGEARADSGEEEGESRPDLAEIEGDFGPEQADQVDQVEQEQERRHSSPLHLLCDSLLPGSPRAARKRSVECLLDGGVLASRAEAIVRKKNDVLEALDESLDAQLTSMELDMDGDVLAEWRRRLRSSGGWRGVHDDDDDDDDMDEVREEDGVGLSSSFGSDDSLTAFSKALSRRARAAFVTDATQTDAAAAVEDETQTEETAVERLTVDVTRPPAPQQQPVADALGLSPRSPLRAQQSPKPPRRGSVLASTCLSMDDATSSLLDGLIALTVDDCLAPQGAHEPDAVAALTPRAVRHEQRIFGTPSPLSTSSNASWPSPAASPYDDVLPSPSASPSGPVILGGSGASPTRLWSPAASSAHSHMDDDDEVMIGPMDAELDEETAEHDGNDSDAVSLASTIGFDDSDASDSACNDDEIVIMLRKRVVEYREALRMLEMEE